MAMYCAKRTNERTKHKWYSKSVCICHISAESFFMHTKTNERAVKFVHPHHRAPIVQIESRTRYIHTHSHKTDDGRLNQQPNNAQFDPISFIFETFNCYKEIGIFCVRFDERTVAMGYKECCRIIVAVHCRCSLPCPVTPSVFHCLIQWITTTMPREKDDTEAPYLDPQVIGFQICIQIS